MLTSASFGQVRDYDLSTGDQWELGGKFDFLDGRGSAALGRLPHRPPGLLGGRPEQPQPQRAGGPADLQGHRGRRLPADHPEAAGRGPFRVGAQYDEFTENVGGVAVSRKGKTPPNVPERVGNLWLTYDFDPAGKGGVDARYVSSVYANNANTWHVPSYTVYGTFLSYRLDKAHADHRARAQPHRRGLRALRAEHAAVLRRRPAHLRAERADARFLRSRR